MDTLVLMSGDTVFSRSITSSAVATTLCMKHDRDLIAGARNTLTLYTVNNSLGFSLWLEKVSGVEVRHCHVKVNFIPVLDL